MMADLSQLFSRTLSNRKPSYIDTSDYYLVDTNCGMKKVHLVMSPEPAGPAVLRLQFKFQPEIKDVV